MLRLYNTKLMMYKTIIFDFGKVLIDYDFRSAIRDFFPTPELQAQFISVFCTEEFTNECDLGITPLKELIQRLIDINPEFGPIIQKCHSDGREFITGEVPGMRQLLTDLKSKGVRCLGLTNWSAQVYEIMDNYPEIFALLDGRIISSDEHLIKPDIRIYQLAIERFNLNPSDCLFVDDKQKNVDGARAAGIDGYLFTTADDLRKFLGM